jgi:hypothetical protein
MVHCGGPPLALNISASPKVRSPTLSGFDLDITQAIPNGALVEVDPTAERAFIRIV